jgi:hypothetical protein
MLGMTGIAVFPAVQGRPSNLAPDQIAYDRHPLAILVPLASMVLSPEVPLLAKLLITELMISGGLTLVVLHMLLCGTHLPTPGRGLAHRARSLFGFQ